MDFSIYHFDGLFCRKWIRSHIFVFLSFVAQILHLDLEASLLSSSGSDWTVLRPMKMRPLRLLYCLLLPACYAYVVFFATFWENSMTIWLGISNFYLHPFCQVNFVVFLLIYNLLSFQLFLISSATVLLLKLINVTHFTECQTIIFCPKIQMEFNAWKINFLYIWA